MSSIDERVVAMKFDNAKFQKGISDSSKSIDDLKKNLNFDSAKKSLSGLDAVAKGVNLGTISSQLDVIQSKFSALSVVGTAALATIAAKAVDAGLALGRALIIDPAKTGLREYETQIGAIQTILANTSSKGTTLDEVNRALDTLNTYSDKTIYNFSEMARNIGTFTAAGVSLDVSTQAIKGIANLAAVSGSNAQQASTAMYQLSQALATGRVSLMDWNSVVNAGMGGEVFQNALKETARVQGIAVDDIIAKNGSFRDSLQEGWLTTEVLTQTLSKFTGELTDDQLRSMGYTEQQIKGIQAMAATAVGAAQDVKTFTQLLDTLSEQQASGWAQTWRIIIGDMGEAKSLWTEVSNTIGGMMQASSDARNSMLEDWDALGGRTALIDAVRNAFNALMGVFKPVQEAFKEIFPPMTGQTLYEITVAIRDFTASLIPSESVMADIKSTAKGLFAVLDIGWMIIQQVVGVLVRLLGAASGAGEGVLGLTGNIGDFLVGVRDTIKSGTGLETVFRVIGDVLSNVIGAIRAVGAATLDTLNIENWGDVWQGIADVLKTVAHWLGEAWNFLGEFFANAKEVIGEFFKTMDFNVLVGLLNVGALAGVATVIKLAVDKILGVFSGNGDSLISQIKSVFGAITDTFGEMQNTLKANSLMLIAASIALLTASVVALSFIDTGQLFIALGAIGTMMTLLTGMLVAMDKTLTKANPVKLIVMAGALILLSTAMVIFSSAVMMLSSLSWEELAKGLIGMAGGLAILIGSVNLASKSTAKMIPLGIGLMAISTALLVLAQAASAFAEMSWEELGKGGAAIASLLLMLAGFTHIIGSMKGIAVGAVGLLIIAGALSVLSGVIGTFSQLSWEEIGKGLATMAGSLIILAAGMAAMNGSLGGSAAMLIASAALTVLSGALKVFATMSWDDIGRALVVMAGGLAILAGAMALMGIPIVLLGSVGILAASVAMMALAPALKILGTMSWDDIGRGLTVLAGALAILAVGGVLLIPAIPVFLSLGIAALAIGTGALLAGAGLTAMAIGITAMAAAGAVGAEALKLTVTTLIGLIPMALSAFAQGIIDFALVIAGGVNEFAQAMTTLITSLLMAIQTTAPMVIDTIWILIVALVAKIVEGVPLFVDAGMKIIIGVLEGIGNNIGQLIDAGANIIVNFLDGIARNIFRIIDSAINVVISFINGVAQGIRENTGRFIAAGNSLFRAIVDGVSQAIENGGNLMRWAGMRIGNAIIQGAMNALGINSPSKVFRDYIMGAVGEGIDDGADNQLKSASRSGEHIGEAVIDGTKSVLRGLKNAVATDMDFTPTIAPVLDLSNIKKDAGLIGGMLRPPTLKVDDSYAYASSLATAQRTNQNGSNTNDTTDGQPPADSTTPVTFIQNNYSPKAISAAESYRNTKNAISVAKGALTP